MDSLCLARNEFLRLYGIGRNTDDRRSAGSELFRQPGKIHGLSGAAGRICARIEKDHELPSGKIGKRNTGAAIPEEGRMAAPWSPPQGQRPETWT